MICMDCIRCLCVQKRVKRMRWGVKGRPVASAVASKMERTSAGPLSFQSLVLQPRTPLMRGTVMHISARGKGAASTRQTRAVVLDSENRAGRVDPDGLFGWIGGDRPGKLSPKECSPLVDDRMEPL